MNISVFHTVGLGIIEDFYRESLKCDELSKLFSIITNLFTLKFYILKFLHQQVCML